jgi:hypothetical protein
MILLMNHPLIKKLLVFQDELAMSEELVALDRTGTWDFVPLSSHEC